MRDGSFTDEDSSRGGPAAATKRLYPLALTCDEIGLCIDGVATLVDREHREAASLLADLQRLYKTAKELEPRADA